MPSHWRHWNELSSLCSLGSTVIISATKVSKKLFQIKSMRNKITNPFSLVSNVFYYLIQYLYFLRR